MKICRVSEKVYAETIQQTHSTFVKFPQRSKFVDDRLRNYLELTNIEIDSNCLISIRSMGDPYKYPFPSKPDCYLTDNPYIALLLHLRGSPFVFDFIDTYSLMVSREFPNDEEKYYFTRYCEVIASRHCRGLIVQSGDLEKQFAHLKVPMKVIPNGVDLERFTYQPPGETDNFQLVYVGKMTEWYASLRNICKAVEGLEDVKFTVIGDGPLRKDIESSSPSNVSFLGAVPYDEVPKWMNTADVCMFCVDDGSPVVTGEYCACGKPIITLKGKLEWLLKNGENGLMVYDTPEEFRQAILTMKEDKSLRERCSKNNLELAKRLDWNVLVKQYADFIKLCSSL